VKNNGCRQQRGQNLSDTGTLNSGNELAGIPGTGEI
jgi:hypothetical protein